MRRLIWFRLHPLQVVLAGPLGSDAAEQECEDLVVEDGNSCFRYCNYCLVHGSGGMDTLAAED